MIFAYLFTLASRSLESSQQLPYTPGLGKASLGGGRIIAVEDLRHLTDASFPKGSFQKLQHGQGISSRSLAVTVDLEVG